ncbi:MAG: four helix bundle protein [Candidatus Omnitrophica bacterium]|nr:four helix bundle protein [Candidatus Omnitrophota bacterium]
MNGYVHTVYGLTKHFPREELYGCTSQLRRSTLSVILNYIEGYARKRNAVLKNFLEISFGSLQESKYLLEFAKDEKYIKEEDFENLIVSADRIGAMLWGILEKM